MRAGPENVQSVLRLIAAFYRLRPACPAGVNSGCFCLLCSSSSLRVENFAPQAVQLKGLSSVAIRTSSSSSRGADNTPDVGEVAHRRTRILGASELELDLLDSRGPERQGVAPSARRRPWVRASVTHPSRRMPARRSAGWRACETVARAHGSLRARRRVARRHAPA